jgi:hypothetical protein
MATDDDGLIGLLPLDDPTADLFSTFGVAGETRSAANDKELQLFPDVASQEPTCSVKPIALEIGLVTVNDKDALFGLRVMQDQSFVSNEPVFFHSVPTPVVDIVISHDKVQSALLIESVQQVKDVSIGFSDGTELPVL